MNVLDTYIEMIDGLKELLLKFKEGYANTVEEDLMIARAINTFIDTYIENIAKEMGVGDGDGEIRSEA